PRKTTYSCGFVPGKADHPHGADTGACYLANNTCSVMQGTGPVPPGRACRDVTYCCSVNIVLSNNGSPENNGQPYSIESLSSTAILNDSYKVVSNFTQAYDQPSNTCVPTQTNEFYAINEDVPTPQLDKSGDDLDRKSTRLNS